MRFANKFKLFVYLGSTFLGISIILNSTASFFIILTLYPKPLNKPLITQQILNQPITKWKFSHYESSEYEKSWLKNIKKWQNKVCKAISKPEHAQASHSIVSRVVQLSGKRKDMPAQTKEDELFSRMYYRRMKFNIETQDWEEEKFIGIQLIEPLWGMLRDPYDTWCGDLSLPRTVKGWKDAGNQGKNYIMLQGSAPFSYVSNLTDIKWELGLPPWASKNYIRTQNETSYKPKNIALDLGSAYFGSWLGETAHASGKWIYESYKPKGIQFDRMVAVEVDNIVQKTAYNQLPADLIGAYTLINAPLTLDGSNLDVRNVIKSLVKPEDFFVLKLDIDSANIEEPFSLSLLKDASVSSLIDEFFFEHHVKLGPMNPSWQTHYSKYDLAFSYNYFYQLRKKGIRAHSWP